MAKSCYWLIVSLLGIGTAGYITGIDGAGFLAVISIGSGFVQLSESKRKKMVKFAEEYKDNVA